MNRPDKWIAPNPDTHKYEEVDILLDELVTGVAVLKVFWANDRYVTIPGASLHTVTDAGLRLETE